METIARLIRAALDACFDCGMIDWILDGDAPETFLAECEIDCNPYSGGAGGDYYVSLAGVLCFVDMEDLDKAWHSELIEEKVK